MRRLIFQVSINRPPEQVGRKIFVPNLELYALSQQTARAYADYCGADYRVITDCSYLPDLSPAFQRLQMMEWLDYDQILYLDSDVVIHAAAPNIFDEYQGDRFCAVEGMPYHQASNATLLRQRQKFYNSGADYRPFCSGVYLINQECLQDMRPIWRKYLVEPNLSHGHDEAVLNRCILELGQDYTHLPKDWGMCFTRGKWFHHFNNHSKKNLDLARYQKRNALFL